MSDMHEVAIDRLRVSVGNAGASWGLSCEVSECRAIVIGFSGRDAALRGGLAHLKWHLNGKPTCTDCGAWLGYKTSTRCRKGTCEAGR